MIKKEEYEGSRKTKVTYSSRLINVSKFNFSDIGRGKWNHDILLSF